MSDLQRKISSHPVTLDHAQSLSPADGHAGAGDETFAGKGVEFALVLARMIDSVESDPLQMRAAVYELARHKLDEQLRTENPDDIQNIKGSLELAIKGVELFFQNDRNRLPHFQPVAAPASLSIEPPNAAEAPRPPPIAAAANSMQRRAPRQAAAWKKPAAIGVTILLFSLGLLAFRAQPHLWVFHKNVEAPAAPLASATPVEKVQQPQPPLHDPLLPTSYGIYAIAGGRLVALKLFPIAAPDIRIAISAAVEPTSQSVLPGGKVRFLVYRREQGNRVAERAEVRIVARIVGTKSSETGEEDTDHQKWVIRNISFPYRIAPLKDHPEIDEITGETDDAELAPGRYVLVLNKEAYDFTVDGPVINSQHCLERIAAANGTFYSQCSAISPTRR